MTIVEALTPAPRGEWNEIVATDEWALIEHTPVWIDALRAAGRFRDASRLYRFADGRRFVVPLVRRLPSPAPQHGFSTGWGIGGPVGADLDGEAVSAIVAQLASDRSVSTHVRTNPMTAGIWATGDTGAAKEIPRRAHVVDLSGGADAVWGRFRRSGRKGVRRAEARDVAVTLHLGGEMLPAYYDLYLRSIARWAERQHEPIALARFRAGRRDPLTKLQAIASTLGPAFRLYLARLGDEVVAANVVYWGPTNAHATRGAIDYAIGAKSNALYAADWAAIRDASDAGFHTYQMGETGENESLAAYKERLGAQPIDYCEYRFERLPLLAIDNLARSTVKRLIGFRDA